MRSKAALWIEAILISGYRNSNRITICKFHKFNSSIICFRKLELQAAIAQAEAGGIVKGKAEGKAEGINSVALSLIAMNMPINQIAAATALTHKEIEALSKQLKQ